MTRAIQLKASTPLTTEAAKALGAARAQSSVTPALFVAEMLEVPGSFVAQVVQGMGLEVKGIASRLRIR